MGMARLFGRRKFSRVARSIDLARTGLVCGTVTLAAIGIGSAVYLQDRNHRASLAPTEAAPIPRPTSSLARLPRSRPDEPLTTGSIDRSASAPLTLEDAIRQADPVRADPAPDRIERLREKAVLIATSWAECDDVTASDVLEGRGKPEGRLAIRIRCANGTRFYLDEEEIEANRLPALRGSDAARLSDSEAIGACENKVRLGLAQPGSLARLSASTAVARAPGGGPVVSFAFDARNGFGFPMTMRARCVFEEHEIARLEVAPR
jgi:hypothetical protein